MNRTATLLIVALTGIVGIQAWLLYREPMLSAQPVAASEVIANQRAFSDTQSTAFTAEELQAMMARQVTAIDARLASIEQANSKQSVEYKVLLGSPEAIAADRKIKELLPKEPISMEEIMMFQAMLGEYPPEERYQLMTAYARAVNSGQIQPKYHN
jgi:hypothetical protein